MEIQYITQVNVSQVERLMYNSGHPAERCGNFLNILSGSEANITISSLCPEGLEIIQCHHLSADPHF